MEECESVTSIEEAYGYYGRKTYSASSPEDVFGSRFSPARNGSEVVELMEFEPPNLCLAKAVRCRSADVVEHRRWPQSGINKASAL